MAYALGKEAKLYYSAALLDGSSVTAALATWVLIPECRDVSIDTGGDYVDTTTRAGALIGARTERRALHALMISCDIVEQEGDGTDAALDVLIAAHAAGTVTAIMALSGADDASGARGFAFNAGVNIESSEQPLGDVQQYNLTLRNTDGFWEQYEVA